MKLYAAAHSFYCPNCGAGHTRAGFNWPNDWRRYCTRCRLGGLTVALVNAVDVPPNLRKDGNNYDDAYYHNLFKEDK